MKHKIALMINNLKMYKNENDNLWQGIILKLKIIAV
jgi:hypothetical protein